MDKFERRPNKAINLTGPSTFEKVDYDLAGQNSSHFVASIIELKDGFGTRAVVWVNPLTIKQVDSSLNTAVEEIVTFLTGYTRVEPCNTCDQNAGSSACERFRSPMEHALYLNS